MRSCDEGFPTPLIEIAVYILPTVYVPRTTDHQKIIHKKSHNLHTTQYYGKIVVIFRVSKRLSASILD